MTNPTLLTPNARPHARVAIRFSTDKAGRGRAHYFGLARRWLPISIEQARAWIAEGKAAEA